MENQGQNRCRPRRGRLLPTSSSNIEVRFLEPFDRQLEARELVTVVRSGDKPRCWLSNSDMLEIREIADAGGYTIDEREEALEDNAASRMNEIFEGRIEAIWQGLSKAWGIPLSNDDRAKIKETVDQYFNIAIVEAGSPPAALARTVLDDLEQQARRFSAALDASTKATTSRRSGMQHGSSRA